MTSPCSIPECGNPSKTRGWCNKHYLRWWSNGSPLLGRAHAARGTGGRHSGGYRTIYVDGEQRLEHVVVVERILGHALPKGAEIHHVNENKADNRPCNLVVCPDTAYHQLLHRRTRAYDACGHADWVKCLFCKHWDSPAAMYVRGRSSYHRSCRAASRRK